MSVLIGVLHHDEELCPEHNRVYEWDGFRWVCVVCILDGSHNLIANKKRNTDGELARYFGRDQKRSVSPDEFLDFWKTLTDEEKLYYRTTPLD